MDVRSHLAKITVKKEQFLFWEENKRNGEVVERKGCHGKFQARWVDSTLSESDRAGVALEDEGDLLLFETKILFAPSLPPKPPGKT